MPASFDATLLGKIANYTEILTKDPHSTVFVALSDAYRQMGMLEDALEVAKNGVAALPRYSPGLVHLGRIRFEMGDLDGALTSLEAAHALDGGSLAALRGLARVLASKGEMERAREILEKGREMHPEDAGIRKMLATLPPPPLRPAPTVEEERGGEPIATPTIAEIYLKQGFPQRALKVYQDLLRVHPDNESLKRKLVDLQQMLRQAAAGPLTAAAPRPATEPTVPAAPAAPAVAATPVAVVVPPVPSPAPQPSPVEGHLAELERWLTALRKRREHVQ